MGIAYNTSIVRDGLVLHLDAANVKSYPGTGTAWNDLSGNSNNGALTNGPTYSSANNGTIIFDGVNDYWCTAGPTPTILQGDPSLTVFGFFRRTGTISNEGSWAVGSNVTRGGICNWCGNAANDISIDMWGTSTFNSGQTYPLNSWVCAAWTKTAGAMTRANCAIFVNGIKYTGSQLTVQRGESTAPNINNAGIFVGSIDKVSTSYNPAIDIGCIFFYSRVLSDFEILQNFNALRGRYGL